MFRMEWDNYVELLHQTLAKNLTESKGHSCVTPPTPTTPNMTKQWKHFIWHIWPHWCLTQTTQVIGVIWSYIHCVGVNKTNNKPLNHSSANQSAQQFKYQVNSKIQIFLSNISYSSDVLVAPFFFVKNRKPLNHKTFWLIWLKLKMN